MLIDHLKYISLVKSFSWRIKHWSKHAGRCGGRAGSSLDRQFKFHNPAARVDKMLERERTIFDRARHVSQVTVYGLACCTGYSLRLRKLLLHGRGR